MSVKNVSSLLVLWTKSDENFFRLFYLFQFNLFHFSRIVFYIQKHYTTDFALSRVVHPIRFGLLKHTVCVSLV